MSQVLQFFGDLKGDRRIWLIVAFLAIASVLAVYSSIGSMAFRLRDGNTEYYLFTHVFYMGIGFAMMVLCSRMHYTKFGQLGPILIAIAIPLLGYTFFFGDDINNANRWLTIPWIDKTFQPSDFAKLALIIFVAKKLSQKQTNIKDFKTAFLPIITPIALVCCLIAVADLSTAALLFVTCIMMMIVGRVSLKYIFAMALIGMVLLTLLVLVGNMFPEHFRVDTWMSRLNDFFYSVDGADQIKQSKIAGIVGAFAIVALYLWLLFRCIAIVTRCPKTFGAILAMGLGLNIVIQAFANIAVSVHLVPVTGLNLPFVSMGGTSLIFTCISLGIILSVSRYVDESKKEELVLQSAD